MTQPLKSKPVQERARKTEQALLDALEELLIDKSMSELTVAQVATKANVTTGAIYRRFKDKNALLHVAFDRFLERTEASQLPIEGEEHSLNVDLLEMLIRNTLHFTIEHIPLMRAASQLNDPLSFDRMKEARNLIADRFVPLLTESNLTPKLLKRRTRFVMRTVTAVARDTFLAGPGASRLQKGSRRRDRETETMIDDLTADLLDMAVPYLGIPLK